MAGRRGGTLTNTTYMPAGAQSILTDAVGQLGVSGRGALEVLSDQPLKVTSRTYNQVSSLESFPQRHAGAGRPVLAASTGLAAGPLVSDPSREASRLEKEADLQRKPLAAPQPPLPLRFRVPLLRLPLWRHLKRRR